MKNCLKLFVVLSLAVSASSFADAQKDLKLLHLAKVTGIYDQLEEQKAAYSKSSASVAQQYLKQLKNSMPNVPEEFSDYLGVEFELYMSKIGGVIDIDHAVDSYIKLIGPKLSIQEVDQIIKFQESELGRKFTQVNTEIMGSWSNDILADVRNKMQVHLNTFTQNIMNKAASYKREAITKK